MFAVAKTRPSCKTVRGLGLCISLLDAPPESGDVWTPHASHQWDRALACCCTCLLLEISERAMQDIEKNYGSYVHLWR